jgi:DNA-binding NtrC family response regulator
VPWVDPADRLLLLLLSLLALLDLMSKLWIVHRNARTRDALARRCGLAESDLITGPPSASNFVDAPAPAAILLGLEGDFEQELEFAHRHRDQLRNARWLLLCAPEDSAEAARLFADARPEVRERPPEARELRAWIANAVAHRSAESLAEREHRERIAERFSAWLGGAEVRGLLRALDPSRADVPLLVRGVPGSGRALLCRYVELFRGGAGPMLRVHGRDLRGVEDLEARLREATEAGDAPIRTIWIEEIDRLPITTQNAIADWIVHDTPPTAGIGTGLRWLATAGERGLRDALEASLERVFAPLLVEVPALSDHPETLPAFAEEIVRDWTRTVGGAPRRFAPSALDALAGQPWSGDRAEIEAVLRTTLACSSRAVLEEEDLRYPSEGPAEPSQGSQGSEPTPESQASESFDESEPLPTSPAVDAEPETVQPLGDLEAAFLEEARASVPTPIPHSDVDESSSLAELSFDLASASTAPASDTETERETPGDRATGKSRTGAAEGSQGWRRLARSLSHEIRNPLVSIRTFAELLPEHFDDETFRERFRELVGKDVAHISDVLTRLSSVAEREEIEFQPVDVSALLESLLGARRERIGRGRLLVLRELERDKPLAWADADSLRVALAGLLDRALESLPERGDLFVATRHIPRGADGQPRLRVLLRHHNPELHTGETELEELDPTANVLEYVLAQTVIEASGGSLTIDSTDAQETVILVDLRTPDGDFSSAQPASLG